MAYAGTVIIGIKSDTSRLVQGMDKAQQKVTTATNIMKKAVLGLGAAYAGFKGGSAIKDMADQAASAADKVGKMAEKFAISTEALSKWQYAAGYADVSSEKMGAALGALTRRLTNFQRDGTGAAAKAFQELGISQEYARKNMATTEQAMDVLIKKFAEMPDSIHKTALAQDIFSKSAADVIRMANMGTEALAQYAQEAQNSGLVVSNSFYQVSAAYGDAQARFGMMKDGLRNVIVEQSGFLEFSIDMYNTLSDSISSYTQYLLENTDSWVNSLRGFMETASSVFPYVMELAGGVIQAFFQLTQSAFQLATTIAQPLFSAVSIFNQGGSQTISITAHLSGLITGVTAAIQNFATVLQMASTGLQMFGSLVGGYVVSRLRALQAEAYNAAAAIARVANAASFGKIGGNYAELAKQAAIYGAKSKEAVANTNAEISALSDKMKQLGGQLHSMGEIDALMERTAKNVNFAQKNASFDFKPPTQRAVQPVTNLYKTIDKLRENDVKSHKKANSAKLASDKSTARKSESIWRKQYEQAQWLAKQSKAANVWQNGTARAGFQRAKDEAKAREETKAWQKDLAQKREQEIQTWGKAVEQMGEIFKNTQLQAAGQIIQQLGSLANGGANFDAGAMGGSIDKLLGADTYSSSAAKLGGTIGSLFGPKGKLIGSLGGMLIGGFFGKKKKTGEGIQVTAAITELQQLEANVKTYESFQKKSWFSKKKWDKTKDVTRGVLIQLEDGFRQAAYLLDRFDVKSFKIDTGKFQNVGQIFGDAMLEAITGVQVDFTKKKDFNEVEEAWRGYAEALGQKAEDAAALVAKTLAAHVSKIDAFQSFQTGFPGTDEAKKAQARFDMEVAKRQADMIKSQNALFAGVTFDNYLQKNKELQKTLAANGKALADFDALGDALKKAAAASKKYQDILDKEAEDRRKKILEAEKDLLDERIKQIEQVRDTILSQSWVNSADRTAYAKMLMDASVKAKSADDTIRYAKELMSLTAQNGYGMDAYNRNLATLNSLSLQYGDRIKVQEVRNPALEKQNEELIDAYRELKKEFEKVRAELEAGKDAFGTQDVRIINTEEIKSA